MINESNAHKYCRDDLSKIENYDKAIADTSQTWVIHHRLELTLDGEFALSRDQLKMHDMYYNRPYYELIFLTTSEHSILHNKGENHPLYGKQRSESTCRKIANALTGKVRTEEHCRNISKSKKGCKAWNKGIPSKYRGVKLNDDVKKNMSEAAKGRKLIVGDDGKKHWHK